MRELIDDGMLEMVSASTDGALHHLAEADRHLISAGHIAESDPTGGFQLAYDAMRKAAAGLLAAQGLRATSRGGHIVVREAIDAQFGGASGTSAFRAFDRMRRARNRLEYPDTTSPGVDLDDVHDAIDNAARSVDFAHKLLRSNRLGRWT